MFSFVRPLFFSLVSLKSVAHLECYKASKSVKGIHCEPMCVSSVQVFKGCFKEVSRVFQGTFKDVSRVSRLFQGRLKVVAWKIQWCFEDVLRVFQGSFNGHLRKFQGRF